MKYIPPRKGRANVLRLIRELLATEPVKAPDRYFEGARFSGAGSTAAVCRVCDERFSGTGLFAALAIANQRHDCIAVTMGDPRESSLPDVGFLTLRDAETDELLELDTRHPRVRALFAKARSSANSGWRAGSAGRTSIASRFAPTSRTPSACRSFSACGSDNDERRMASIFVMRSCDDAGLSRWQLPESGVRQCDRRPGLVSPAAERRTKRKARRRRTVGRHDRAHHARKGR